MRALVKVMGLLAIILMLAGPPRSGEAGPAEEKPTEAKDEVEDVLAEVQAMNGPGAARPPTNWRQGHVSNMKFNRKAIKRTQAGFEIQMARKTAIPTPTVHDGKLFVGGGFNSKQFHAFDARSGKLLWAVNLDDDGPSSAVVDDGVVVFNTESCTIFALDASTGKMLWSWWLGDPLTSTPTIAKGRVFTSYPARGGGGVPQQMNGLHHLPQQKSASPQQLAPKHIPAPEQNAKAPPSTHALAAFDLKTGKVLWQRWIDSDVMSAPVASGDELHAATFSGTTYVFSQRNGEIRSAKRSRATSAPVIDGKQVYYTQRSDKDGEDPREAIAQAERTTGRVQKQMNPKQAGYLDQKVQMKSGYATESLSQDAGNGFGSGAPAAANPQASLSNVGLGNVSSMQAFQGSRIARLSGGNNYNVMGDEIVSTDPRSGKVLWSRKLHGDLERVGGSLGTAPAAAGNHLFVATLGGKVMQIRSSDGKTVREFSVGAPVRFQPAIVDGRIYVGTQDGRIVCLDTGDRSLTGWSTWGGNPAHTGVASGS